MANPLSTPKQYDSYTVAVICATGFEMNAARYILDHEHPRLPSRKGDSNIYVLGELSGHNVVLACTPGDQGKGAAATVATNIARTFPSIKWRMLVGIGGGMSSDKHDIRLGDVVVSMPEGQYGGVVQYALGKDTDYFRLKRFLWPPPTILRSAVELMRSDHLIADNKVEELLPQMLRKGHPLSVSQRPPAESDILFNADYPHVTSRSACENCDMTKIISRPPRQFAGPEVHYGLIASGDRVMRNATKRNATSGSVGDILCFEMEAAGIATEFPCIVIRGVSDYADSHKNDSWQHYAAAAAAAYAKELLSYITPEQPFSDAMPASPGQDEAVVKLLLDTDMVDPDDKDEDGRTLRRWAAQHVHEAAVKLLLEMGKVDPDARRYYERTTLPWAAQWGGKALMLKGQRFLNALDSTHRDRDGELIEAWIQLLDVIDEAFRENIKATTNGRDYTSRAAPSKRLAVTWKKSYDIVRMISLARVPLDLALLQEATGYFSPGIRFGIPTPSAKLNPCSVVADSVPLYSAFPDSIIARPGIVNFLTASARPEVELIRQRQIGDEALLPIAAKIGNLAMIKLLFECGADIDGIYPGEGPALVVAAYAKHMHIFHWLLVHGANAAIAKGCWDWMQLMPVELGMWAFAEETHSFGSVTGLLAEVPILQLARVCRHAIWEWEVLEFIRRAHTKATGAVNLESEIFLTTTAGGPRLAKFLDKRSRRGHTRAYTWNEMRLGLDPFVMGFVDRLLEHVADHLDETPEPLSYEYTFVNRHIVALVRYDENHLTMEILHCADIKKFPELLRGIEVLCTTLRPASPRHSGSLSVAQWSLERYEISPPTRYTRPTRYTPRTYGLRVAMGLKNKCLPVEVMQHGCWQLLFDMGLSTVVSLEQHLANDYSKSNLVDESIGEGLEMSFEMMVALAAVEFPLVIDNGIIFIGYETVLVPVAVAGNAAQFHLITRASDEVGQINPYTVDLGPRVKIQDVHQFQNMRCFLGWCKSAQINLGTEGLRALVNYTERRELDRSLQREGYSFLSQFGASAPLNAVLGFQTNFKYTNHQVQFTPLDNYKKLLRNTARELAIIYDDGAKRCWLVPKLSLLLHMAQAYAIWTDSRVPFVDPHADASTLPGILDGLGQARIGDDQDDELLFRELMLGLNTNLLATASSMKRSSGKTLYGFEFMDVVTSPGRGTCIKELTLSSFSRNWLDIVNVVDAVVVCSDLGLAISAIPDSNSLEKRNPICNALPHGLDYLAATIPCLNLLAYRRGGGSLSTTVLSRVSISQRRFWGISGDPFTSCSHEEGSSENCWDNNDRAQQIHTVRRLQIMTRSEPIGARVSKVPLEGAVAFH